MHDDGSHKVELNIFEGGLLNVLEFNTKQVTKLKEFFERVLFIELSWLWSGGNEDLARNQKD